MENWRIFIVVVFDENGTATHVVNNLDFWSDALSNAEILRQKYSGDYKIDVFKVEFSLVDSQKGSLTKKQFMERI